MTTLHIPDLKESNESSNAHLGKHTSTHLTSFLLSFLLILLSVIGNSVWAQTTKTWVPTTGGSWATSSNWSPAGVPVANDHVIIPSNQSQPITGIPSISLRKFIIRGSCQLESSNTNNLITVNDSFTVSPGITVTIGAVSSKFSITLSSTSIGKIEGIFVQNTNTPAGSFTSNGVLELEPGAFISGVGSFTLNAGATLRIGSPNGILTGTVANGNIRVSGSRTYSIAANYIYDGIEDQVTGDGLPNGVTGSLSIDNPTSVTLTIARTISSGTLNLQRGIFQVLNRLSLGTNTTTSAVMVNRSEGSLNGSLQGVNLYSINYLGSSKDASGEISGSGLRNIQMNLNDGQTVRFLNNFTIPGSLTMTKGNLNIGANTLIVSGSVFGGSPLSYIMGRLQLSFPSGTTSQFFPLGSSSGYSPVFINFGSTVPTGVFTASSVEGDPSTIENSTLNIYRTINRFWSLQPGATLATAVYSATLEWNASNTDQGFEYTNAIAGRYSGSSWSYPSISSRTITTAVIAGQSGAGEYTLGKNCTYTSISKEPLGGAICSNENIELSVEGAGDGTLNYQWLKDGTNIDNAITSKLTTNESGVYTVVVAGECRSITSVEAVVTVKPTTEIKSDPVGGMKCAGDILLVEAEGSGTLAYQWKRNDIDLEGATASTFSVTEQGMYSVSVTGECGSRISQPVEINMHAPTEVTLEPEDKEITYGENVNFSVEAAGTGDLTYKWQSLDAGTWVDVASDNVFNGASSSLFGLTTPSAAISGTIFKCVVSGFCGEASSREVNLIIRKASLTVTASDATRMYGDPDPEFQYTLTGFVNGEDLASSDIKGIPLLVPSALTTTEVGEYEIMPEIGTLESSNYSFEYVPAKLTITQAPLIVTAVKKARYYGDPNPDFSVEYIGLKNDETVQTCDVTGAPAFTTEANELSGVDTFLVQVEPGDVTSKNYSLTFENSILVVEKAILTITPYDIVVTYGDTLPDLAYSVTGYKNQEEGVEGVVTGNPTIATDAVDGGSAGVYDIIMTTGDLSSSNYTFDIKTGSITIKKAELFVTADNFSKVYGNANPAFTYSITGFIIGENVSNSDIAGTPILSTSANELSPVSTYPITIEKGDLESNNYKFNFTNGTLNIAKATLTVTALDKLKVYGDPNPAFDVTFNGFVNNEIMGTSGVTGSPSFNTNATITSSVGSYNINPGQGSLQSGNYQFAFVSGKLYVGKAALTVKVDTMRRDFGSSNPVFTYKFSGFKNSDNASNSGITGTPVMTTTATIASLAGKYPINASVGTLNSTNYSFDVYGGQLGIDIRLSANSSNPVCPTVGEGNITLTASGSPGTVEFSIDSGVTYSTGNTYSSLIAGAYHIKVRDDQGNVSRDSVITLKVDVIKWVGTNNGNPSSRVAWENAANWNGGRVPSATSHVIIPGVSGLVVDVNSNVQAASVQVGSGARLNINSNFKLTTTGKCPVLPAQ